MPCANQTAGGPGIGKGTVCAQLAQDFDFCHISVGDLLRELIKPPKEGETRESPFAGFITNSMKQSVIVPPDLTISLLLKEMDKASAEGKTKFLIDGFPRSVDQAALFEQKVCIHSVQISQSSSFSLDVPGPSRELHAPLRLHRGSDARTARTASGVIR